MPRKHGRPITRVGAKPRAQSNTEQKRRRRPQPRISVFQSELSFDESSRAEFIQAMHDDAGKQAESFGSGLQRLQELILGYDAHIN